MFVRAASFVQYEKPRVPRRRDERLDRLRPAPRHRELTPRREHGWKGDAVLLREPPQGLGSSDRR
jgi:hypothetical protein